MGNNYTTSITINALPQSEALTWKELHSARFAFESPFQLNLADNQIFFAEKVVRLIPRRRLVVYGTWQGKAVVGKLFFSSRHAKRQMEQDVAGIRALQKNKIPTPALYYQGISEDQRIYVLLFERIFDSKNLEEIWREKHSIEELVPVLHSVIIELATQHVLGVLQRDLHLKNFLLTEKIIYALDGAEIELFPYLLPKKMSMKSLALFFSQLGITIEPYRHQFFKYYAKARGWILKKDDLRELDTFVKQCNDRRWQRFARKIFRESTNFACKRTWKSFAMLDRSYADPEFLHMLNNPESAFSGSKSIILKAGHSATVIKIMLDGKIFVVKRYNIKNFWHRLKRCLRPTRAALSWRLANKLNLFGVLTAKPIAFIERNILGFRGTSYYITEYISGDNAGEFFNRHEVNEEKTKSMVKRLSELLKNITKLNVTHGDLKITNILIDKQEQPVFIDLDGAKEHLSRLSLSQAFRKEKKRFLKNFSDQPTLWNQFNNALRK